MWYLNGMCLDNCEQSKNAVKYSIMGCKILYLSMKNIFTIVFDEIESLLTCKIFFFKFLLLLGFNFKILPSKILVL